MNKATLILTCAFAITLGGCDSRDENEPLFGAATPAGSVPENTEDSENNSGQSGEMTGPQGNNPGLVPIPVLAELTTLDVSDIDTPRGHKIFAGNEIRGVLPGSEFDVEYSYFNLDFPCVGSAVFENYPSQLLAAENDNMVGDFVWEPIIPTSEADVWKLQVNLISAGDEEHSILQDGIEIFPVNWGEIIVGSAIINKLVVTRIVQYEECSS